MLFLAEWVILAGGWRRRLIALVAGATGALAMAPVDFFPAAVVPMTIAVWLIDGAAEVKPDAAGRPSRVRLPALRNAFAIGWWWGFGYFLAGLWWLGAAFLVEPDQFAWMLPFGVIGLPAVLALYPALGFALARLIWSPGAGRIFALAVGLGLSEWLRGRLFTGFPWNAWGMVLGGNVVTGQLAALVGLDGLTVVTIALFAAPAVLPDPGMSRRRAARPVLAALAALALVAGFGALRLQAPRPGMVPDVRLRIMQPNITQDAKFNPDNKAEIVGRYLALSDRATGPRRTGLADITTLIWPESAFPFILSRDPQALTQIGDALPAGTILVTGAARAEVGPQGRPRYFNAIQVLAHGGDILDSADKVHLVPFGEYLPFDEVLTRLGLHRFVNIPGGFEAGGVRRLIEVPGLPPVAPLVCYEAIFPGEVVPRGALRPGLLLNVTDDGWFGLTAGPYQHLAQARLRSIEEGLPLVRAATTGISAIVDPYGRILESLPLGTEGVLDGTLPKAIAPPLAARAPFLPGFALWLACLVAAGFGRWAGRRA